MSRRMDGDYYKNLLLRTVELGNMQDEFPMCAEIEFFRTDVSNIEARHDSHSCNNDLHGIAESHQAYLTSYGPDQKRFSM